MPYFGRTTLADVLRDLARRPVLPQSGRELLTTLRRGQTTMRPSQPASAASPSAGQPATPPPPSLPLQKLHGYSYVEAVLWLGCCLADGLAHAHERGILHRDLKPANILLTDDGQPMLLDFNLSEDTKLRGSISGAYIGGTLPYMAPEHLEAFTGGTRPPDARSDIFSLGIILYELLTCRAPFALPSGLLPPAQLPIAEEAAPGGTASQQELSELPERMIADRRRVPPTVRLWNRAVSPAAAAIIRRCLEPDPDRRYQTARQLQEDLQCHLEQLPLRHAGEPSLRERCSKWVRRHPRLLWRLTGTAAVLILIVAIVFGYRAHHLTEVQKAETALKTFQNEMGAIQFLVNTWSPQKDQRPQGLQRCRQALDQYGVLDDPAWRERPRVTLLAPPERQRLQEDVGEMLLLLARGRAGLWLHAAGKPQPEDLRAALDLNQQAETCYPEDGVPPALWRQRAELLQRLGDEDEARRLQERAATAKLRTARDYYLQAREEVVAHRHREALPLLEKALRLDPRNFWATFLEGDCHEWLDEDDKALTCYTVCVALAPDFHGPYLRRGELYRRKKQYELALADYDKVIELRPDLPDGHVHKGLLLQELQKDSAAIEALTAALDRGAAATSVYFRRAESRERTGDREGAQRDRAEGLRREPADDESWDARGSARLADDPRGALSDFEHGLELNPHSWRLLQNKASVLGERLGRDQEALQVLDQLVDLYPRYGLARGFRGVHRARLQQWDGALQDARDALACGGSSALLRYQAGCIYALCSVQDRGHAAKAVGLLWDALRSGYGAELLGSDKDLNPIRDLPEFHRLLGEEGWLAQGTARLRVEPKKALSDFEQGLALNPRSLPLLQRKSFVLAEYLHQPGEALQTQTQAVQFYPEDAETRSRRGVLHARLKHWPEALQDARDALARQTTPQTSYQVACIYALCSTQEPGHAEKAVQLLADALRGGFGAEWLDRDRDLDPIRESAGFKRLLEAATKQARP
jgi:tetratricopeptide (TPR) repeat protein